MGPLRTTIYCAAWTVAALFTTSSPAAAQDPLFESRWKLRLPDGPAAGAAYDGAQAYIPLQNGELIAIALNDGRTVWTVAVPTAFAPAVGDARLFVASGNEIRALEAATGRAAWRRTLDADAKVPPLYDTGWLFVGTETTVVALRAADGDLVWKTDLGAPLSAPPALGGSRVYLPVSDGRIVAIDLQTGKTIWTRKLGDAPSDILVLDDRLFVGSEDKFFYCLALQDGDDEWKWPTGGDVFGAPVVDEARVYFMSLDNVLRALNRGNGHQQWQEGVPNRTIGGPLRSGSLIVVASLSGQLHAYHRMDGKLALSSPAPEGDAAIDTLIAPPLIVAQTGREAFLLLTRQGVLEVVMYLESAIPRQYDRGYPVLR